MTRLRIRDWADKKGFTVEIPCPGERTPLRELSIRHCDMRDLRDILNGKIREQDERRWVVEMQYGSVKAWGVYRQGERAEGWKAVFYGDDDEQEARAHADRKNREEGLA